MQQTSEWEGVCMGIPEQVDRNRWLEYQGGPPPGTKGAPRLLGAPGSRFEYNDVRINQPKSGSYPVAGRPIGGLNGPIVGAIFSLT